MDIGIQNIVDQIASSTTGYLVTFSPVFLLMGGLILAFGVMSVLLGFIGKNDNNVAYNPFDDDDDDDRNRGKSDGWI